MVIMSHAHNVMGLKIQELIKDLYNAHSQTDSGRKDEVEDDQMQRQLQREFKILYKNMVTGESCKDSRNLSQQEEEIAEIDAVENRICIEEHKVGGYECT